MDIKLRGRSRDNGKDLFYHNAIVVGASARTWRAWESGFRAMPGSKWELWEIKTKREVAK